MAFIFLGIPLTSRFMGRQKTNRNPNSSNLTPHSLQSPSQKPDKPLPVALGLRQPKSPEPVQFKVQNQIAQINTAYWFQPGPWRLPQEDLCWIWPQQPTMCDILIPPEKPIFPSTKHNQNNPSAGTDPTPIQATAESASKAKTSTKERLQPDPVSKTVAVTDISQSIEPAPPKKRLRSATTPLGSHLLGNNRFRKYHIESVPTREKWITLSFDGDHLDNCTAQILEILAQNQIRANVFLTGKFIELFPNSVLAIHQAGHEIGNHTWSHPHLTQYEDNRTHKTRVSMTKPRFLSQIRRTETIFRETTGEAMRPWWRAPYGEHNLEIRQWAYAEGYLHIGWSKGCDSMDWMVDQEGPYYLGPQKLKRRLLRHLETPGHKIILMHLGSKRPVAERPFQMLSAFISEARKMGYQFTTISALLRETKGFQMASLGSKPPHGEVSTEQVAEQ